MFDRRVTWWLKRVLKWGGLGAGALVILVVGLFFYAWATLPTIHTLADYKPPQASRVYSDDGHLVAFIGNERRSVVPVDAIPEHVRYAFIAAEDAGFYQHSGLDYFGIFRAAVKNMRPGAHLQGASTITQQTVKTLVVGAERSLLRKLREAMLSRELEAMLSKDGILHLYLNQIYFGQGAYGVEEASRLYFNKSVRELDLGEAAYLAAIPKNPSHYTIARDPLAAKERQKYVLQQMVDHGWADAVEASQEMAEGVPAPYEHTYLNRTPHYVEQVRRELVELLGEDVAYNRGLTVYTGMYAGAQVAAQESLRQGLEDLARRQGWAGAPVRIEVDRFARLNQVLHEAFDELTTQHAASGRSGRRIWDLSRVTTEMLADEDAVRHAVRLTPLGEGARVVGMVTQIDSKHDLIWVDLGSLRGRMTLKSLSWARRFAATSDTPVPKDASEVVKKGDLVAVNVFEVPVRLGKDTSNMTVRVELVPQPVAEGALVSIDPYTRLVRALVGGYQQEGGGLIRAVQARRQPGSAFKPIVYAAGLDATVITPASTCPDSPVVIYDRWTGKPWKPQNYEDGRFDGNITYRTALMRSKNTCSVKLIDKLGPDKVITMARAMGVTSELPENLTLALGTGDLSPLELCNAYATIAAGGIFAPPIFIRKVVDASGTILKEAQSEPQEVLRPAVAFVLTQMMRSVVEQGTATRALVLDRPLAGKTGTSNESRNVWFSGFSPELVATVWVGFDNNAPLGRETGGSAALPIWIRYMGRALAGTPPSEFSTPEDVVVVKIDPQTGIPDQGPLAIEETFLAGTEPLDKTRPLESIFIEDDTAGGDPAAPKAAN